MKSMKKAAANLLQTLINRKILLPVLLLAAVTLFSLSMWIFGTGKNRYVLTFEHMNKTGLYAETRYLPKVKKNEKLEFFIKDMILGPVGDRYKTLFPRGTKVLSCFVRDKVLYVSLSEEAFYIHDNVDGNASSQNKEGAEIFRKNVFRNFRNIDIINLYIDGRKIYE